MKHPDYINPENRLSNAPRNMFWLKYNHKKITNREASCDRIWFIEFSISTSRSNLHFIKKRYMIASDYAKMNIDKSMMKPLVFCKTELWVVSHGK
jgi:hypothetical protein